MRVRPPAWTAAAVAALWVSGGCGGDRGGSSTAPPAPVSPCAVEEPPLRGGSGTVTGGFNHGAFCREYALNVPPGFDGSRPVPLVVALHGYTGTPASMEGSSGLSRTADARGFVVVYPAGLQNAWDMTQGGRDAGFVRELVVRLQARGNIDRRRIHVTGFSMGGGMANRVACCPRFLRLLRTLFSALIKEEAVCRPYVHDSIAIIVEEPGRRALPGMYPSSLTPFNRSTP